MTSPHITIWSSLARKRSLCPVCRRSFGRMKAPVVAPQRSQGITARTPDQFARKAVHNGPQPGKHDYFAQPETYSRSGAWELFSRTTKKGGAFPSTALFACAL